MKRIKRRYAEGGDVEDLEPGEGTARRDIERSFERVGKSAREEGEEEFARTVAKRRAATAKPSPRAEAKAESKPATIRDTGEVPVREDERTPREDSRPQARQPSGLERALEAFPAGAAGVAGAAALGSKLSRAMNARRIAEAQTAAKGRSADALRRATEARSAARSAAKEAESSKDAMRMAEEGGMRYGRGAPQPRRMDQAQRRAFIGDKSTYEYARGGSVSSTYSRGDGIAQKGKTRGRMV